MQSLAEGTALADEDRLVIVVPVFKPQFLHQALASIAAQTDRRFECRVFDDAGPPELARICAEFPAFRYHRFDRNLGGHDLVAQWNRCLAEVQEQGDAPWVWLFSDDDVMAPNCVAEFHAARARQPQCRVFQFALDMVGEDLQPVLWQNVPPALESAAEFVTARLRQRRLSCLPEHVFHAPTLRALGGLVNLPLAWGADDATWARLGQQGGIGGVPQAKVLWRQSGHNISRGEHRRDEKLAADLQFLQWLRQQPGLREVVQAHGARWLGTRLSRVYGWGLRDLPRLRARLGPEAARALAWAAAVLLRDALRGRR